VRSACDVDCVYISGVVSGLFCNDLDTPSMYTQSTLYANLASQLDDLLELI
jgi:hypothetical protein